MSAPAADVEAMLRGKAICVCAGPGGVGKTTTAAAIAVGMAARGKKVAVLTIDPARRLANSLGLEELGNEARRIDDKHLAKAGITLEGTGELWAMMLDAKRTFDDLIEHNAPDSQTRDAVLGNRIYQELSSAVAGSQEYMAMEKLYELHEQGDYDLLVLDTPPTRNALDFLDAPKRLSRFIDSRSLQFFTGGGLRGFKLFSRGTGAIFAVMKRATGIDLLQDLSEFFRSFGEMAGGFRERAERVNELLADKRTSFVVVTSPARDSIDEAVFFHRRLSESGLSFGGVVVNRMHELEGVEDPGPGDAASLERELAKELAKELGDPLARKVARNLDDYRRLAGRDRENLGHLRKELGRARMITVPHLDEDVHDLAGLARMNEYLFRAA